MEIINCGTKVKTKLSNIEAMITGITIRFGAVAYELSYFKDGDYKQCWMNEREFDIIKCERSPIGFKQSQS
jgi:hypothetical protein